MNGEWRSLWLKRMNVKSNTLKIRFKTRRISSALSECSKNEFRLPFVQETELVQAYVTKSLSVRISDILGFVVTDRGPSADVESVTR